MYQRLISFLKELNEEMTKKDLEVFMDILSESLGVDDEFRMLSNQSRLNKNGEEFNPKIVLEKVIDDITKLEESRAEKPVDNLLKEESLIKTKSIRSRKRINESKDKSNSSSKNKIEKSKEEESFVNFIENCDEKIENSCENFVSNVEDSNSKIPSFNFDVGNLEKRVVKGPNYVFKL